MTIDEVIEHCNRTVEFESKYIMKGRRGGGKVEYSKRYLEHKLVAEWLKDYKKLKSIDEDLRLKYCYEDLSDADNLGYLRGYNKAIDDFIKKLEEHEHNNWVDHLEYGITRDDIEQIAHDLKEHKTLNLVHCKDCKHWGTGVAGETENVKCCECGRYMVGMNGYCVYGEKECAE